ncbi:MAG: RNA methyltransferase [Butyrivibrio sp.]|nr:RNA methyltransferase [Butyrivibrio sp.]
MPTELAVIDNFDAEELDIYARLTENQLLNRANPEEALFIAESPKVIMRALDAGCIPVSILVEDKHIDGEGAPVLARCKDVPVYTAPFDVLTQITGFKLTRGMLCAMRRPKDRTPDEICADKRRVAVIDNVVNPTNVGAIIRSAAALNMDAVLLTEGSSNPLYRRAIRVSMGTVFQIPWAYIHKDDYIDELHRLGYKTVAMALTPNSVSIDDEQLAKEEKLAVILGTEGDGLAQNNIENSDYTVMIPMTHGVDSLNVAAASAVAFWQLGK